MYLLKLLNKSRTFFPDIEFIISEKEDIWEKGGFGIVSDCIFCNIINGELNTELLYEDDQVIAFKDINPKAPIHFLIVPKKHIETILDLEERNNQLIGHIYQVAKKLAQEYGIAVDGYRVVANCNENGGQVVFHIHFHLLGGKKLGDIC